MLSKILFAGLGNMGLPMSRHLLVTHKYDIFGYDINPITMQRAYAMGIKDYKQINPNELDTIISVMPDAKSIK